jgi:hypothetical protein
MLTQAWRLVRPAASALKPRPVLFLPVAVILSTTAPSAQLSDITQPPPIVSTAGQFSARRLGGPVVVDGHEWIAVEAEPTSSPGTVRLETKAFSLTTDDCGDHCGDFERCRLLLWRGSATPVRIDVDYTGWIFVTPDARYIIQEPLYVLDVGEWKQYALSEALQIPNYTRIVAISRDGTRLFIPRRDCALDCKDVREEYFEVTLP